MTGKSNILLRQCAIILIVALAFLAILSGSLASTNGDQPQAGSLAFRAFTGLADVYRRGGQAPDLVAKLNAAINLTEQAKIKRDNGDLAGAASLESQAQTQIAIVTSAIPAAQQNADQITATRTITAVGLVPVSVIVSTLICYAALRTWRAYKRRQFYEMRIIEKKT